MGFGVLRNSIFSLFAMHFDEIVVGVMVARVHFHVLVKMVKPLDDKILDPFPHGSMC